MPADAIERVNRMAENTALNRLIFGDRENKETTDDDVVDVDTKSDTSSDSDSSSGSGSVTDYAEIEKNDEEEGDESYNAETSATNIKQEKIDTIIRKDSTEEPENDGEDGDHLAHAAQDHAREDNFTYDDIDEGEYDG